MYHRNLTAELALRVLLFIFFTITDHGVPYRRTLQPEELWLYRYPHSPDYYPGKLMWLTVLSVPIVVFVGFYLLRRDSEDLIQAALGVTLSIYITGCITNILKLSVGRLESFLLSSDNAWNTPVISVVWKLHYPIRGEGPPDHVTIKETFACSGDEDVILQGLKSFPSGHASLSFSSLGFVALYIAGKLQVFNRGRGKGWRFISFFAPLIWALMIAVSRTSDYHHHWQDVTVGSIIGLGVCYICYRQVYPSVYKVNSHLCYSQVPPIIDASDKFRPDPVTPLSPHPKSHETEFNFISKLI